MTKPTASNLSVKSIMEGGAISNPFPGLRSFEPEESHLFFGRSLQTDELLRKLRSNRLLAVVGTSGSGKSSLIKCGLVPRLEQGFTAQGGSGWRIATFRPGDDPIGNMGWSLAQRGVLHPDEMMDPNYPAQVENTLRRSSLGLVEAFKQSDLKQGENLLILVDQFEEIFRHSEANQDDEDVNQDAINFINLLLNATRQKDFPVYIVLTLRSDFLGDCTDFRGLPEAINDGQFLIPRMKQEEIKAAITGPLEYQNVAIDPALVNRLLKEINNNVDQLPILQHALMRMWNYWADREDIDAQITAKHYEGIGTMRKALSNHAEEAYAELNDQQKKVAAKVFKALTDKSEDNLGTSRHVSIKELMDITEKEKDEIIDVIEVFRQPGRTFILAPPAEDIEEETVVDISHESLMRVWMRLVRWITAEMNSATIYERLAEAASLHYQNKSGLWRNPELQIGLNWVNENNPNPAWAERYKGSFKEAISFLLKSKEVLDEEEKAISFAQRQKLRRARTVSVLASLMGLVFLVFGGVSFYYFNQARIQRKYANEQREKTYKETLNAEFQGQKAKDNENRAKRNAKKAKDNEERANRNAEKAEKSRREAIANAREAKFNLKKAVEYGILADTAKARAQRSAIAAQIAYDSAETSRLQAVIAKDAALKLKNLSFSQALAVKSLQAEEAVLAGLLAKEAYAINKESKGSSYDPYVYAGLYQAVKDLKGEDHNKFFKYPISHENRLGAVRGMVLTNNGKTMFTSGSDGKIWKWDLAFPKKEPFSISSERQVLRALAISPSNTWLAKGGDKGIIEIYNTTQLDKKPVKFTLHNEKPVRDIHFLPNSTAFISVGDDNTIQFCDLAVSTELATVSSRINTIDITNNGALLFAGNEDGQVLVWNILTSKFEFKLNGTKSPVTAIALDPKNNYLAVGKEDGSLLLYDLNNLKDTPSALTGHKATISQLLFDHNGSKLVSGSYDHTARLWVMKDINNPKFQPAIFADHDTWVMSLLFTKNSKELLTGTRGGTLKWWETELAPMAKEVCQELPNEVSNELLVNWKKLTGLEDVDLKRGCN